MKKITLALFCALLVMGACQQDPPKEKPSNTDLIVGTWQSQLISYRKLVQNKEVLSFDSAETKMFYSFTTDYFVYMNYDSILFDTARYNFDGDTLYFIKNARAYDTMYINLLDEFNMHLMVDFGSNTVNGITITEETVGEFIRLSSTPN